MHGAAALVTAYLRVSDRAGLVVLGGMLRWLGPAAGDRQFYRIAEMMLAARYDSFVTPDVGRIPRTALPPGTLVVVFSPLLDPRGFGAITDLRQRGFPLIVVDTLRDEPPPLTALTPGSRCGCGGWTGPRPAPACGPSGSRCCTGTAAPSWTASWPRSASPPPASAASPGAGHEPRPAREFRHDHRVGFTALRRIRASAIMKTSVRGVAAALGLLTVAWPLAWAPGWAYAVAVAGAAAVLAAVLAGWRRGPVIAVAAAIAACAFSRAGTAVLAAEGLFILGYLLAADAPAGLTRPGSWLRQQAFGVVAGLIASGAVLAALALHQVSSAALTAAGPGRRGRRLPRRAALRPARRVLAAGLRRRCPVTPRRWPPPSRAR